MNLSGLLRNPEPTRTFGVPSLDRFSAVCKHVHDRWPDVMPAPEGSREIIARQMLRRIQRNDWKTATLAFVIRAGRVAFEPEFRGRRDLREVRTFYIREAEASTSAAFLGALLSIYLGTYEPGSRHSIDLAAALDKSRRRLGEKWLALLRQVPFLLDPNHAARRLGADMCKMDAPYSGLLELGFQDPHAAGLLHHAHLDYVEQMRPALAAAPGVHQMLNWLVPRGIEPRVTGVKEAIEALLGAWRSREPPAAIRDTLIEGLVSAYGDPRVRRGGVWPQVSRECRDILLRWLTGANIEFFLDVVSEVETSHMWQPRREFWWGLYEEGRIDDAWVAFSPNAASVARRLTQADGKPGHLAFGEQSALGYGRRYTSLLILKIGACTIVEGSHSYKVQVFKDNDPHAPRLFEKQYDCEKIRLAPGHRQQAHHGRWEHRVRELIERFS